MQMINKYNVIKHMKENRLVCGFAIFQDVLMVISLKILNTIGENDLCGHEFFY